ncbi:Crp/Fnr family transcriptional regulator [Solwaraspora sp. WMMD406]|uniref:Crp/Fnr family transcriptional regulator n=1 Tax=Solwaraspora sp. WMMD406 TaxID=3016095 RepID=UPI002416877E|nr:Crp/Fnr family transcriptional regulator [Solwaraspora sp. WMMD406]MDG4766447.1 Crp/Fnr family transcriptional regulator [Solwaraspora sp. WMMD406]
MDNAPWLPGTFLARLQPSTRKRLLSAGVRRSVKEAQVMIHEGAEESYVVLLDDALVKVTAALTDGRHALLSIRVSGDVIGEISALNETPRTATVTACRPSVIRVVHRNEFMAFLRDYPDAALTVAGIIADRLRWANRRRIDFTAYTVRVRLARVLWELAAAYGRRSPQGIVVDIRLTQDEMATLCGAAQVSAQKALSGLRADGIVAIRYRGFVVRDSEALRSVAKFNG